MNPHLPSIDILPLYKSHGMRFPTMWHVRPAKAQTSLRIRTDISDRAFASRLNIL